MTTKTKGLLAFILLAFGPVWLYEFSAHLFGLSLDNPLVQLPMAFAPAIAALITRLWITKEGFSDAGFALHLKRSWPYYLLAWLWSVLVILVVVGLASLLRLAPLNFSQLRTLLPGISLPEWVSLLLLMGLAIVMIPVFWGEEFGWRSYLQLRLWPRRQLLSALVTGLIWAVWHYPLLFLGYITYANILLGLLSYTCYTVLLAIMLAWLRLRTASIWPACLAHAGGNMILGTLTGVLLGALDVAICELLSLIPLAALCAWIILKGKFKETRTPDVLMPAASWKGSDVRSQ
ncbi:CPBP family intramembrane metalloprotease [Ktedonosporobacter rubrisoli]|uniref:CPBP family intramembrane metalloprotease n=1 Tax=Ktedonosporobacter rubrisoli TaxID=2509675 RepID=A0A4P6JNX5_KTERU|nr:CPBP family intramembrane glutamic endopeptidase [Ktedonosporobacter rubrisoli]QBD76772.1 CPBP family intramembrane metalloprotease [Ktedonosporobacter rubrisoli]